MIFAIGPQATGQIFADALQAVFRDTPRQIALGGADVDNEMRFYAVLWMAYGGVAVWVVRSLHERVALLRVMLCIFMLGGLGRAVSYLAVGASHLLFVVLMWIELVLPPVPLLLSLRVSTRSGTITA